MPDGPFTSLPVNIASGCHLVLGASATRSERVFRGQAISDSERLCWFPRAKDLVDTSSPFCRTFKGFTHVRRRAADGLHSKYMRKDSSSSSTSSVYTLPILGISMHSSRHGVKSDTNVGIQNRKERSPLAGFSAFLLDFKRAQAIIVPFQEEQESCGNYYQPRRLKLVGAHSSSPTSKFKYRKCSVSQYSGVLLDFRSKSPVF